MRVLLVKTSSLGDVIHTLPALTDACRALPDIHFDWVVEETLADIPRWHPGVDQVIPVALRRWRKNLWATRRSGEWRQFKARMAASRYDLILDAQGLVKSAYLTRLNPAPTAGYDKDSIREPLASRFYHRRYAVSRTLHAVERIRQLFAQALGYPQPQGPADYGVDIQRLPQHVAPDGNYVVFCHGTTWVNKLWPESYWRQLVELVTAAGVQVMLPWGNEEERHRAERLVSGLAHAGLLPKLGLQEIASVLARAQGVVAMDTGLGHLAAAVGAPTVALYGPTDPRLSGNYGQFQQVLASSLDCAPCLKRRCRLTDGPSSQYPLFPPCFEEITPQRVWQHLTSQMSLVRTRET